MARQKRLHVPHGTYYVIDQFAPGSEILAGDLGRAHTDTELERIAARRQQFEIQLSSVIQRWGAHVDAHCWLPDAALLVLHISLPTLECIMHSLHGSYSHYLHTVAEIGGRPYPERYRALLLDPKRYLLDFARHVLTTPVRAGLSQTPLSYPYSSTSVWLGTEPATFVAHSRIPDAIADRGPSARVALEKFLGEHPEPGFPALLRHGSSADSRIAGDAAFVRAVHRQSRRARQLICLDHALRWAADVLGFGIAVLTDCKRSRAKALTHALAAWLITCSGAASLSATARSIPCRKSTLHTNIERNSQSRPDLFNEATLARYIASTGMFATNQQDALPPE